MKKILCVILCVCVLGGVMSACKKPQAADGVELLAHYAFDEGSGNVTRESVSGKDKKISYVFSQENQSLLYKEANDPLWRKGVSGKSLYMDGYSTCITDEDFRNLRDGFTVSAFVAPRAFEIIKDDKLTTVVCKGDPASGEGFVLGYGSLGEWTLLLVLRDPTDKITTKAVRVSDPNNRLELYKWNHIAAAYSPADARVSLYFNGVLAFQTVFPDCKGWTVAPSSDPLMIGQFVNASTSGSYKKNSVSGLLDEVRIYSGELSAEEVKGLYTQVRDNLELPYSEVALDGSIFESDRYRPQYHALPDGNWMNEPHAPIYFNGKYHLFFQHNAIGPYFEPIQWGHFVSDDMVSWKQVKNAVVLKENISDAGVWTGGSVIGPDGAPWLVVTAGSRKANGSGQNIAFAHPVDPTDPELTDWVLEDVVAITQDGYGVINEFRDPFVWRDGDTYFMTVSGSKGDAGTVHAFKSTNMRDWEYKGDLYTVNGAAYDGKLSTKWECCNILPVSNVSGAVKYALFVLPQYPEPNYTEIYYFIGNFNKDTMKFTPDNPEPRLMDYGGCMYNGAAGFCFGQEDGAAYESGRTVLFALAQGRELSDKGWMHNVAMPLELRLSDDGTALNFAPIAEIANLRGSVLAEKAEEMTVAEASEAVKDVRTDCAEIKFTMTVNNKAENALAGIDVRCNTAASDGEYTRFAVTNDEIKLDRTNSTKLNGVMREYNPQKCTLLTDASTYDVTIYLDRSMLEIYVNDALSFTSRVYTKFGDSDGLRFIAENCDVKIAKLKITAMKNIKGETPAAAYWG